MSSSPSLFKIKLEVIKPGQITKYKLQITNLKDKLRVETVINDDSSGPTEVREDRLRLADAPQLSHVGSGQTLHGPENFASRETLVISRFMF